MRHRVRVKVSPIASIVLSLVGIGMLIFLMQHSFGLGNNSDMIPDFPSTQRFGILFIFVLVGFVLYHIVNAFTGDAPSIQTIEIDTIDPVLSVEETSRTVAAQLRELEELRQEELISETEYEELRFDVLSSISRDR